MVDTSQLTDLISALRAETEANSVTPERVGYLLQQIVDKLPSASMQLNAIKGYVVISSTSDLPKAPTTEQQMKGYLLGTTLYVYVGEGGDTLEGLYQSVDMKGPKGNPGTPLGETEIVDDLDSDAPDKVLSARQGKRLKEMIGSKPFTVVDDLETGGRDVALSAEMGKKLRSYINDVYDEVANGTLQWTDKTYYYKTGEVKANNNFETCLFAPIFDTFETNVVTGGGYICFFNSNMELLSTTTKSGTSTATIAVPTGTAFVGVTNQRTVQANPYIYGAKPAQSLADVISRIAALESFDIGEMGNVLHMLYQDLSIGTLTWEKGKNYSADGTIASNYAWEATRVRPLYKTFKTNIDTLQGGFICFFDGNGDLISSMTKNNTNVETITIPTGTVSIGLSNYWGNQPSPSVSDVYPIRTLSNVDNDITVLKSKTAGLSPQIKYAALGDSISSNETNMHSDGLAYPGTLAKLINAELTNLSQPGAYGYNAIGTKSALIDSDTDIVTVLYGRNDISPITNGSYPLGDIEALMQLPLSDSTLLNSFMGRYRYYLETLKARLKGNALIVVISPIFAYYLDEQSSIHYSELYQTMRAQMELFVRLEGGPNNNWFYINGLEILPADTLYYINTSNERDETHPNVHGQAIMAKNIFNNLPDITLFLNRK